MLRSLYIRSVLTSNDTPHPRHFTLDIEGSGCATLPHSGHSTRRRLPERRRQARAAPTIHGNTIREVKPIT